LPKITPKKGEELRRAIHPNFFGAKANTFSSIPQCFLESYTSVHVACFINISSVDSSFLRKCSCRETAYSASPCGSQGQNVYTLTRLCSVLFFQFHNVFCTSSQTGAWRVSALKSTPYPALQAKISLYLKWNGAF